jgi:hypothetical protein
LEALGITPASENKIEGNEDLEEKLKFYEDQI